MVFYFVTALYVFVCFTMMLVVYLQQGKGGDIASAFGGGSSQAAFGARSGATVLSRATWICAAAFIIGALALGILGKQGPGSVLGGLPGEPQPSQKWFESQLLAAVENFDRARPVFVEGESKAVPGPKAPTPPRTAPAPAAPAAPAAPK